MDETRTQMRQLHHADSHGGQRLPLLEEDIDVAEFTVKLAFFSFWIAFVVFNIYLVYLASKKHQARRQRLREESKNQARVIAKKLAGMTIDAKISYYNMLFAQQGNEMELRKGQIFSVKTKLNGQKHGYYADEGRATHDDVETGTIVDAIARGECDIDEQLPLVQLSPTIIHNCKDPSTCGRSDETMRTATKNKIDGHCVICLELYNIGDTITYNMYTCRNSNRRLKRETSQECTTDTRQGCSHVYHKTCLVQYLSNRKISQKGLFDGQGDTPLCPTCREPFVELLPIEDERKKFERTTDEEEASITHVDDGSSASFGDIHPEVSIPTTTEDDHCLN